MAVHIEQARSFAMLLGTLKGVLSFEVFGSVAREGVGKDLDLIVIMDEEKYLEYCKEVLWYARFVHHSPVYAATVARKRAFLHTLGSRDNPIFTKAHYSCGLMGTDIDVFVFPAEWRSRLPELQEALPHEDPAFMEKIAQDARPL